MSDVPGNDLVPLFCLPSLWSSISEKHRSVWKCLMQGEKNVMGSIKQYSDYLNMDNLIS